MGFWKQIFFTNIEINENLYWLYFTHVSAYFFVIPASFELIFIFKTCQILWPYNFIPWWHPKLELSSTLSKISKNAKKAMSILTWNFPCSTLSIMMPEPDTILFSNLHLMIKNVHVRFQLNAINSFWEKWNRQTDRQTYRIMI